MNHELKTLPLYFNAVLDRRKTFEIRRNDRDFQVGDTLILREYTFVDEHDKIGGFTGRSLSCQVVYITDYGQPNGQVVLGITF